MNKVSQLTICLGSWEWRRTPDSPGWSPTMAAAGWAKRSRGLSFGLFWMKVNLQFVIHSLLARRFIPRLYSNLYLKDIHFSMLGSFQAHMTKIRNGTPREKANYQLKDYAMPCELWFLRSLIAKWEGKLNWGSKLSSSNLHIIQGTASHVLDRRPGLGWLRFVEFPPTGGPLL